MTEQEYCDLSDLQLFRSILRILQQINAFEDPNALRLRSITENVNLSIKDLEPKVSEYMDRE